MLWKLPVTGSATYTDNLYGSILAQSLNSGTPVYQTTLSPDVAFTAAKRGYGVYGGEKVFVTGYLSYQQLDILGQSYGLTQFGGSANYNFGKRFKGLTVTLGVNDGATEKATPGPSRSRTWATTAILAPGV